MKPKTVNKQIIDFYRQPGKMTSGGKYAASLKKLPQDAAELTRIVQGLAIHEYVASTFYGFDIPDGRLSESHIRSAEEMLDCILDLDDHPLTAARPPEKRIVGVCHHFSVLLVAMLRAKNIPARVRYGFGDYFNPGFFEDHSLGEYWNAKDARWVLVDPQFDDVWQAQLQIKHDILDVPRDHFLIAGDAWIKCRAGEADPSVFGIFHGDMRGLWFIAGNLVKDIAALNRMEMLQWDAWGAMPRPNNTMQNKKKLAFFDRLAVLTQDPDESFDELLKAYEDKDNRLHVPERVFNAIHRHLENI
jgi:hypothetical protein